MLAASPAMSLRQSLSGWIKTTSRLICLLLTDAQWLLTIEPISLFIDTFLSHLIPPSVS